MDTAIRVDIKTIVHSHILNIASFLLYFSHFLASISCWCVIINTLKKDERAFNNMSALYSFLIFLEVLKLLFRFYVH